MEKEKEYYAVEEVYQYNRIVDRKSYKDLETTKESEIARYKEVYKDLLISIGTDFFETEDKIISTDKELNTFTVLTLVEY